MSNVQWNASELLATSPKHSARRAGDENKHRTYDNSHIHNTQSEPPICVTVSAPTNIAVIKYWGKKDSRLNTPINSSASVTLDQHDLRAVTSVAASPYFKANRLWLNGVEEDVSSNKRFNAVLEGVRSLAQDRIDPITGVEVTKQQWPEYGVHVVSMNTFPTAAGLASSAAGYAALTKAFIQVFNAKEEYPGQFTAIARQGSGSASRSLHGGLVQWSAGVLDDGSDSFATQIADEHHWPEIRALILVVSDAKKGTSSTAGMQTSVATSELLAHRASVCVAPRLEELKKAYLAHDFGTFGELTMKDSNQFHATCLDTHPPIFYMNDISRSIIQIVHAYNNWAGEVRAAYTFDAGPNAVIYTLEQHLPELTALMRRYFNAPMNDEEAAAAAEAFALDTELCGDTDKCRSPACDQPEHNDVKYIYSTRSGAGATPMDPEHSLLDSHTGLPFEEAEKLVSDAVVKNKDVY